MKASELVLDEYYTVKGYQGSYQYKGQRKQKPHRYATYEAYVMVFVSDSGTEVIKATCHGVEPCNFVSAVPVRSKVASAFPQVDDYDKIQNRAEMFATFLTTLGIKPGVTDVDINGLIVPTIYITPNDFDRLQNLIQSLYLSKMEIQ